MGMQQIHLLLAALLFLIIQLRNGTVFRESRGISRCMWRRRMDRFGQGVRILAEAEDVMAGGLALAEKTQGQIAL